MKPLLIFSSSRADIGILSPLMLACNDLSIKFSLCCFGQHSDPSLNSLATLDSLGIAPLSTHILKSSILNDNFHQLASSAISVATSLSDFLENQPISLCVILGDRYEMLSAAYIAHLYGHSILHIHGGEQTLGSNDDKYRDCITRLSDYHFVTTTQHADRVKALSPTNNHIYNVGSLSLSSLPLKQYFSIESSDPKVLIIYHPTLNFQIDCQQIDQICDFLCNSEFPGYWIAPNQDLFGSRLLNYIHSSRIGKLKLVTNLSRRDYFQILSSTTFYIGNSSSGIIEAPSFGVKAFNLGSRQQGRMCCPSITHMSFATSEELFDLTSIALGTYIHVDNPYHTPNSATIAAGIVQTLQCLR